MSNKAAEVQQTPAINEDILWGSQAIADEINRSLSEVQYLIRTKKIPYLKLGPKTIVASRKQLRRALTPRGRA
jgi:hypothetical protein